MRSFRGRRTEPGVKLKTMLRVVWDGEFLRQRRLVVFCEIGNCYNTMVIQESSLRLCRCSFIKLGSDLLVVIF